MKALASHSAPAAPASCRMPLPLGGPVAPCRHPFERHDPEPGPDHSPWLSDDDSEHAAIRSGLAITPSESISRRRVGWPGVAVETIGATRHGRLEFRFNAPVHLLVVFECGGRSDGYTFVEGLPRSRLRDYKRKLIFVPAGHEYVDWQETRSLPRLACFYFNPTAMPLDGKAPLPPRLLFEDPELLKTALKLKTAVEISQAHDRAYCAALGIVLAHDLVQLGRGVARQLRGGLAGWQQQTVARYIDERLAENVSLATLAGLVRLSPCHFSRAFKQSFGMPPHRFHTHRRIERAKALLGNPEMSATEVGMAIGFSSASSFTMSFRKVTGMTPTDYRRTMI